MNGFIRCIVKLGAAGILYGIDIDTSHFDGKKIHPKVFSKYA